MTLGWKIFNVVFNFFRIQHNNGRLRLAVGFLAILAELIYLMVK
jgi:hypothetical protein